MSALAELFRTHGPAYCAASHDLPARHRAVIDSIAHCRTEALGRLTCSCDECGRLFDIYRSCGNRHCPLCGKAKGRQWLAGQLDRLLPVPHFMITFTVPAAFRSVFLRHQKRCYQAFFRASSAVLAQLGSESTYFPGDMPGFFGVLHTWGRKLTYHPHIHYIVPAGAFERNTHRWHDCPTAFYAPVRILSKPVKARPSKRPAAPKVLLPSAPLAPARPTCSSSHRRPAPVLIPASHSRGETRMSRLLPPGNNSDCAGAGRCDIGVCCASRRSLARAGFAVVALRVCNDVGSKPALGNLRRAFFASPYARFARLSPRIALQIERGSSARAF